MGGGLADRSIISRLSVKVRKAGAQMLAVSISGALEACIDGMADVSGKWETGRDWRAR